MERKPVEVIQVETMEQLKQCFEIRLQVFVEEQQVPVDLEMDEYDESPQACRHMLFCEEGKAVATARWKPFEGTAAKLQRIAVLASHRGQGLGRLILQALEQDAKARGCDRAVLDGQTQAEAFYHKLGYETISKEPFLDAGIWHVRMQKYLT